MLFRSYLSLLLSFLVLQKNASSKTLRDAWVKQLETGLEEGKHLGKIFQQEKPFAIYNQIHLLSNFLGTVDGLVSFLQGYDYKTDHSTYVRLKKKFVSVNNDIEKVLNKRFGYKFKEIYFELKNIQFSYVLLNRFLSKVVDISCIRATDCKGKLKWTIQIFKKDFAIEDHYNHIVKATLTETRFAAILDMLKETSNCDTKAILEFGRNLLVRLFKAEQVVLVYRKLTKLENSMDEIIAWSKDMYSIRKKIFELLVKCSNGASNCTRNCEVGRCAGKGDKS